MDSRIRATERGFTIDRICKVHLPDFGRCDSNELRIESVEQRPSEHEHWDDFEPADPHVQTSIASASGCIDGPVIPVERPTLPCALATSNSASA